MSNNDIYVSFGADTGGLEAALALTKQSVAATTREMNALAKEMNSTGAAADSDLGQQMTALGARLTEAKAHASNLKNELRGVGKSEGGEGENVAIFERLGGSLRGMLSPVIELKGHFAELAELIAGAFAIEKVADWASETTEAAEKIENLSHQLGVPIEQVERLQGVAKMSGVDFDGLAQQFERLQLELARTGEKSSPAAAALRALGVNISEFRVQSITQQMDTLAGAVSRFADGATKTAAVQALGRGFVELLPILDKGKKGVDEVNEAVERSGQVMNAEAVAAFAATRESINELSLAMSALSKDAYGAVNSAVNGTVLILTHLVEEIHESITENGVWAAAFGAVGWALRQVVQFVGETILIIEQLDVAGDTATKLLIEGFRSFGITVADVFTALAKSIPGFFTALVEAGKTAVEAVEKQFVDLGTVIDDTLHLNFSGARAAFGQMGEDASASAAKIGGAFKSVFDFSPVDADAKAGMDRIATIVDDGQKRINANAKRGQDEYDAIWGLGAKKAEADAAEASVVPQMSLGGGRGKKDNTAAKDAEIEAQTEIDAYKRVATEREKDLDEQLKTHRITMAQWLAQTVDALQDEEQDIQDTYAKELQTAGLTSTQILQIKRKEAAEIAEIEQKIRDANYKAAEDSSKAWDAAAKQVNSAFDGQINGLLRGTTSWSTAFKNVLATLTEDVIKFFVNWGLQQAETVAKNIVLGNAQVSAHIAGNTAMAASDASSGVAGLATMLANAGKAIAADAGQAAAGVTAFLAPILGPAAPAAGEAVGATVLGMGGIGHFDIGAWNLSRDQVAMVHQNEMIMPAAEAGAFRSMLSGAAAGGGGGGNTTHNHTWNISSSAADARDVARQVAGLWNRNPSMRPAY